MLPRRGVSPLDTEDHPLHPQRVLLLLTEHLGQLESMPSSGQLPAKPQGTLPSAAVLQQMERLSQLFASCSELTPLIYGSPLHQSSP